MVKYFQTHPDNSAKDNSADLKFGQFSQKYADNSARGISANNSDTAAVAQRVASLPTEGRTNQHLIKSGRISIWEHMILRLRILLTNTMNIGSPI